MKQNQAPTGLVPTERLSFEDLYAEISKDWQKKSARLQARRWRLINQRTKAKTFWPKEDLALDKLRMGEHYEIII